MVPILAKDEEKQKAIKEKASKDAASAMARNIGATTPAGAPRAQGGKAANIAEANRKNVVNGSKTTIAPPVASATAQKAATAVKADTAKKPIMVIQPIPPFKGTAAPAGRRPLAQAATSATVAKANGGITSPTGGDNATMSAPLKAPASPSNRLNVNASSFRPNPKASAFTPVGSVLSVSIFQR